jgi:hypothetical protein
LLSPISFRWQGAERPIVSTGRYWHDEKGFHILVMTPEEKVFELVFLPGEMQWYLGNLGEYRNTA